MPDEIVGIAILDNSIRPRKLYALHLKGNGQQFVDWIPVYDYREPKPCDPCWQFRITQEPGGAIVHGIMECRPSVHWRYQVPDGSGKLGLWVDRFHNAGQWSVKFNYAVPPHSGEYQVREANGMDVRGWQ